MADDTEKVKEKIQGKGNDSLAQAVEGYKAKNDSNDFAKKISEGISKKLSDSLGSLKDMTRPGSLMKTAGLMTNSPFLMTIGDGLNDLISSSQEDSMEDNHTLQQIEQNTTPVDDFEAEERNNDQIERDEKQLSFLDNMVAGFENLADKMTELTKDSFLGDLLAIGGIALAVIIAPLLLISGFFEGVLDTTQKIIKGMGKTFQGIRKFFRIILGLGPDVAKLTKEAKIGTSFFGKVGIFFSKIKSIGLNIGKFIGRLGSFGKSFVSVSGKIAGIGKLFGKLFPLIVIIMAAFDTIKGVIRGFAKGGIVGALKEGVISLFNSLIFGPLDLLKDLVGWILGKLGFENAKNALASFSFSDLFRTLIGKVFDGIKFAIDYIKGLFTWTTPEGGDISLKSIVSNAISKILDWMKGLLDIDFGKLVEDLPGYGIFKKITGLFGSDDENPTPEFNSSQENGSLGDVKNQSQSSPEGVSSKNTQNNQYNSSNSQTTTIVDMNTEHPDKSLEYGQGV